MVPAVPEDDDADVEDSPLTFKQWLIGNSISLAIIVSVLAFVLWKFDLSGIVAIATAALGLSFVVFIHELGHFLVAKWCDVEVTTFSIGFGPAIPGCAWRWGETTYKLSLIPVGGYVQMVGQVDGDEASDGSEDNPRSYRNKSVGQRMAIISAGVIMNVILAIVVFIVVYQGPGKDRAAGVVGRIDTAMPAFKYGIRTSANILQVGDVKDPNFEDLVVVVMGTSDRERLPFIFQLPSGPVQQLEIEPRLDKDDKKPMIGLQPAERLTLRTRKGLDPGTKGPFFPGSAAADIGLQFGDNIIACSDPDAPKHAVTPLPDDPRMPGKGQHDYFAFERRMKLLAGEAVTVTVEREEHGNKVTKDFVIPPMYGLSIGARMQMGQISVIRHGSPAVYAELKAREAGRDGDVIEAVEVTEADGKSVRRFEGKTLDPVRLPQELKQWAQRLADAEKSGAITTKEREERSKVKLTLRRHREAGGPQFQNETVTVRWDDSWRFDDALPMSAGAPMAIPELGFAYQIKTIVADTQPVDGKANPLQPGDVIKNYRITYVDFNGKEDTSRWLKKDLEEGDWARIANHLFRSPMKIVSIELRVDRGKEPVEVTLTPAVDSSAPLDERGWILMVDMRRQKAEHFYDAIMLGLRDTRNGMVQVFQNVKGMITGRVSLDNLGGPVMIANFAYKFAGYDFWEFVFFLGLISVNLAVVNFLPVPVLDGGHMVFLIYEKLRGRPASEPVRVGLTYAGLAMILSLFLFVTWNDIHRFFFS
jgi:regulator of sigma E protease